VDLEKSANNNMNVDIDWLRGEFPKLKNLAKLNEGGQKIVFSAIDSRHGYIVLKLIHPSQSEQTIERERLAVDQVQSPRVPRIYETGTVLTQFGTCYWFIEELIRGDSLRRQLNSGALDVNNVLKLGIQMLEALTKAEEVNIVHRDVKPENIMISSNGDFWLLDFGIARHLTLTAITDVSARWGKFTPGYAPPEQFRNIQTEIDSRADLFALGVTLYESATAVNPYWEGQSDTLEVLRNVEKNVFPVFKQQGYPAGFTDFISSLTQRRRDHRPKTACEALEWLTEIMY
jgi:serine/threonine protein kinase